MRYIPSSAAALCVALSSFGAWAQNGADPKIVSTVVSEFARAGLAEEATLTRTNFIGRVSWRVKVTNNAANELTRVLFTAQTEVLGGNGATSVMEPLLPGGVIPVGAVNPACTLDAASAQAPAGTRITCNFAPTQALASKQSAEFIVVVRTPTAGSGLRLHWTFGGTEGKGGTNGCCTAVGSTSVVTLVDAATNPTAKTHVQSTAVKGVLDEAFTGIGASAAAATQDDPWKTVVTLGGGYLVNNAPQSFTQVLLDEFDTTFVNPDGPAGQSCSAIQANKCWVSKVKIPDTTWTKDAPLRVRLDRHSSIIKNGARIDSYFIEYKDDLETTYRTVELCKADWGTGTDPDNYRPCLESACQEIPLGTTKKPFVWRCNIKALKNGGYKVR